MNKYLSTATNVTFVSILTLSAFGHPTLAHGVAGHRVFPATMAVEDPAVADELTLPQVSRFKEGDEGWATETEIEYSKRITNNFGLSIGTAHVSGKETEGWDNLELGAKYQIFKSAEHEALISLGLGWNIGNSGSNDTGESFDTITPTLFFGKGFGDAGVNSSLIRPFAVTGVIGFAMPTDRHTNGEENPDVLEWGLTLQYSLPYFQQYVKDAGLSQPFNQITPIIEFSMETPVNGDDQKTTGTINPGLIWSNQSIQIGAEAILPVNSESGDGIGARVQIHFPLDDIFSGSLGKPIWD